VKVKLPLKINANIISHIGYVFACAKLLGEQPRTTKIKIHIILYEANFGHSQASPRLSHTSQSLSK
jgi:hypothetical protein